MRSLVTAYELRTSESRRQHERLTRVLPGGETRSATHFEPYPLFLREGAGCALWDVDGNHYTDVLNNYTSLIHGHSYGPVIEALGRAASAGTAFTGPHHGLATLAELLVDRYPAVDQLRFTNSGTEAAMLALRIVRHFTGRTEVVLFEGGYHGTAPQFTDPDPSVHRVPYNDEDTLRRAMGTHVAAVFAEPFLGSAGVIPASEGFLAAAASIAHAAGALFVLDEVQSLRNSFSGVHGELGLKPDLILMGKIIGGGTPVGAVGGRRDVMAVTAATSSDSLVHSGTFNGNPLTMAAGIASMERLDEDAIQALNARAATMAAAIGESAAAADIAATVTRSGSILHVHLQSTVPRRADEVTSDHGSVAALHLALLLEGVYAAPRGMLNLSTAMSDADAESVVTAYTAAFRRLSRRRDAYLSA